MNTHERQFYWTLVSVLIVTNMVLLVSIWFVSVEQRHNCESGGMTLLDGKLFDCEVHHVR